MYRNMLLSFLVGLPCAVSAAATPSTLSHTVLESRQTPSNSCATGVHVITGPGAGAGGTDYSYIGTLVNNITSLIPGSNSFLLGPYEDASFVNYTAAAEVQLDDYLQYYTQACPNTYLVLVGYSAGAVTTMNSLCGASPSPPWPSGPAEVSNYPFVAYIAYGDETYAANQPYNAANCTQNAPNGYRTDNSACSGFFSQMQSYCLSTDPECCTGGNISAAHFAYPDLYDVQAAQFVAQQYNAVVGGSESPSNSKSSK